MKKKKYTIGYFIKKFTAIPDEKWTTGKLTDGEKHCALGFCGVTSKDGEFNPTPESIALGKILRPYFNSNIKKAKQLHGKIDLTEVIWQTNDFWKSYENINSRGKENILFALNWVKLKTKNKNL